MSYSAAAALQSAIYAQLTGWAALSAIPVVDALPPGSGKGTFVLLGPETANDQSDKSGAGAEHLVQISVISDAQGFMAAKTVAGEVSDALVGASLSLATGVLVGLSFVRASARRLNVGDSRRIDLTFRARVEL
ncbi:DUF3168 domain-containing protein [bacterium]|nr:DUF3168 domain-containing protein [bacterium]